MLAHFHFFLIIYFKKNCGSMLALKKNPITPLYEKLRHHVLSSPRVCPEMKLLWSFLGGNGTLGQFYCSQLWQASQPEQPWFHLVTHCHTGISCSLLMVPPFTQKHTEPPAFAMRFHLQSPSSVEPHSACLHWKDYDSNFLQSYSAQQMEGDSCLWQGS